MPKSRVSRIWRVRPPSSRYCGASFVVSARDLAFMVDSRSFSHVTFPAISKTLTANIQCFL